MGRAFTLLIEKEPEGGYSATVAEHPACTVHADTLEEVRALAREALALYLEESVSQDQEPPRFVRVERLHLPV